MAEGSVRIARPTLDAATVAALCEARHGEPFALLGPHDGPDGTLVRALLPNARRVEARSRDGRRLLGVLEPVDPRGLFEGSVRGGVAEPYLLSIEWPGAIQETEDPYSFGALLGALDLHLFSEGRHFELGTQFGAQLLRVDGVPGVRFAVWAPNARRVAVVGDFNSWDTRRHGMRLRPEAGVWEIFVPRLGIGAIYKFAITGPDGAALPFKADPIAAQAELPPATASVVADNAPFHWRDREWMATRGALQNTEAPIAIYEVHAASWQRPAGRPDGILQWAALTERLIPYVAAMGFTHLELMPVAEHPFGGSWGYQPLGLFAPSARFGPPEGFMRFVDAAHRAGIGVIVDWVPAHFPTDAHGLARFDGTALYEHLDPREGYHRDWNTYIYNVGRREVGGFLIASAMHWLDHFHVDGLRVDAVASMLYRDYSRGPGEWIPNRYGGRENLEAIEFLRHLNAVVAERCPGAITVAEESTAFPGVSRPVADGGLGFAFKWNMGWMHDTLHYLARDPVHRRYHHDAMTFGLLYAFSENFILPLSHDEVVYGKASLIGKMPGDYWQKFANLRAYFGFMWAHPGKKLLFMGGEIAQWQEWNHDGAIDWDAADNPLHAGMRRLLRDLNRLYRAEPALHRRDARGDGFRWVIDNDRNNSVFAFLRIADDGAPPVLAVVNFTPVQRDSYRVGVPASGDWRELFNSDATIYGGGGRGNGGRVAAHDAASHGFAQSLDLTLPPLAALFLQPVS
ncbi:MAG TPA: 1,4-alpha-glucan branching protein GlgB [Stellaceae bacterium]|nr:1,4-alpha-glucan branching protein GlgB [Stellaceae bacterium]